MGLIPSWTKDPSKSAPLINARADTVADKPSFRSAFKRRRCLIPADGYYEWKAAGRQKQPYLFEIHGGEPFVFAGIWEACRTIESCAIITTSANELASQFHDRMPVILSPNDYDAWLDPDNTEASKLLTPYPASEMTATAVSTYVNKVANEGPQCVEPVAVKSEFLFD
jgi:putative SOS response-associated peptidase YedK